MLPEYEKNVYLEYLPDEEKKDPNLLFVNNQNVQTNIAALRDVSAVNSFAATLDLITYEILEVRAMEEALKTKERLDIEKQEKSEELLTNQAELAKLMGGKTTFKSIFSRGSKSEQIQKLERENPDLEK
jgi:sorting nexin-1/2/sorting nexin-4